MTVAAICLKRGLWAAALASVGCIGIFLFWQHPGFSFRDYGEVDWSLPPCSKSLCAPGSQQRCRYTDSPCRGKFCNKNCDEWYEAVVANDGVPSCTCEKFCTGACYTPTCTACPRQDMPLWLKDLSGPLGTGLLCCPLGGTPGKPEACCQQGHREKYNSCCELEAPSCDCDKYMEPNSISSFDPRKIGMEGGLLAFSVLALPALFFCRRPLPRSLRPRAADVGVVLAYVVATLVVALDMKRYWQSQFKPDELLPASGLGRLAAFTLSLLLLPLDRTNLLFRCTRTPFERTIKFHRWAGRAAVLLVVAHGVAELYVQGLPAMCTFENRFGSFGNFFGLLSGIACMGLAFAALSHIRRSKYQQFLTIHRLLALVIYVAASLHCLAFALMAGLCAMLHAASWLARFARRSSWRPVSRATRLDAGVRESVLLLQVNWREPRAVAGANEEPLLLPPGAWYLLQAEGDDEWHPFSVAYADDQHLTFLVKDMGEGTWSSSLAKSPPETIRLEGPYGGPAFRRGHCSALLLVAGGVGVTPLARLWRHPPPGIRRVELVWVVRRAEAATWLSELLPPSEGRCETASGRVTLFVTGEVSADSSAGGSCNQARQELLLNDSLTNEASATLDQIGSLTLHWKRPDLMSLFEETVDSGTTEQWGVIACGPQSLVDDAQLAASACRMRFHSEEFAW
mmetsp:Transcript_59918/g.126846  ORF Transcript_59918/g.126846 Transcript_59918/m.126846 type:complete len:682 (+) Transcript_59918:42-2087(+)